MNNLVDPHAPSHISAADWGRGIGLSLAASMIAGASKLAIRKSWLIQQPVEGEDDDGTPEERDELTVETHLFSTEEDEEDEEDEDSESLLDNQSTRQNKSKQLNPFLLRYSGMFGMSVLNPICSVFAMNYASPSILAPFSGLTLVWVILFSSATLGEQPTFMEMAAAILIMLGEIIVAVFGDHTNDQGRTVQDVRESYSQPASIAYFVGLALYMTLLFYWILYGKNQSIKRFAWGSCGGAITGPQNFLKDSLTILKAVSDLGDKMPWFFAIFIVMAMFTAFSGLLLLTACMKRYDATYSAAAFVGSFVVSASINAACHYHTFKSLPSTWNDVMYPMGLVVLMIGVFILEKAEHQKTGDDEPSTQDASNISGNRERKDSDDSQAPFAYSPVDAHQVPFAFSPVEPEVEMLS